ncbi:high affinity immunoglobulin gamma Fc receptor I-like [Acipenser ruthenus]|uniref:high affinity immunoglobulin gamma Fc receptor I-like n=1 Tax=Acipenser ruthenus TaxID=7906 RepID=UPI00274273B5|nr:high affinity immunoglobulin gamma Fc receptor I-like [Acipenser ruthenus]
MEQRFAFDLGKGQERPQAVLTQEPAWTQIYESESVTLRCQVQGGYTDWRFTWYKDGRNAPVTQDYYSSIYGDRFRISSATGDHSGEYTCKGERTGNPSYSKTSDALTLRVSVDTPKPVLTREPAGEIFEGDTVTLSCVVEGGSGGWRYLWYKDRQGAPVYQTDSSSGTGAGYTISAAALSHSGEYWCGAGRGRNTSYLQYSDPIWVNVTSLFSRVTLTASPGASVKEGEALNLTCEAAVNKTPRPQLHYTIVRDGEPVTNSTDSALYSIASTEKSHTGSYTCAVESQGVKKSSQELHIELQTSWHSAVAIGYRVSFTLIHFTVFTLLLLQYCRIQGSLCLAGGKSRKTSDQDQEQSAEGIELSSRVQHTGVELE